MGYFDGLGGLIFIAVWIFCFIDVLVTPEDQVRNLPKLAWVFIVLLLPLLGCVGWLVAGHNWTKTRASARFGARPGYGAPARRPGRMPTNPDDDEEFLASLRKRAEEQRRRAREQNNDERPDDPR